MALALTFHHHSA